MVLTEIASITSYVDFGPSLISRVDVKFVTGQTAVVLAVLNPDGTVKEVRWCWEVQQGESPSWLGVGNPRQFGDRLDYDWARTFFSNKVVSV